MLVSFLKLIISLINRNEPKIINKAEGIGEDILPENVDFNLIDHFEKVTDKDGAIYTRKLAKEEGLFCGYSCGSAIAGLDQLKHNLSSDDVVVVLLHDQGSRYIAKVYNDEWMKSVGFL